MLVKQPAQENSRVYNTGCFSRYKCRLTSSPLRNVLLLPLLQRNRTAFVSFKDVIKIFDFNVLYFYRGSNSVIYERYIRATQYQKYLY